MNNELPLTVVIALSKCSREKGLFGIRFEEKQPRHWAADWAFAIREKAAAREGYDNNEIAGNFSFADEFPGCPYCANRSLVKCFCGKVSCFNGTARTFKCPWCNGQGELGGVIESLNAGGDR